MAEVVCRFCSSQVSFTDERSRNWYCAVCKQWDARGCLSCGTTAGFPVTAPWVTPEEAKRSPFARADEVLKKALVYCELHFHNSFFIQQEGLTSSCLLCGTSWDRRRAAVHRDGITQTGCS